MADNVPVTPGVGADIATDDVAGVHYQRVKLNGGGDGASTPILAGGGVEADSLRVTIANDSTGLVSVDDNGGSLTIDAPVGTPAFVRLSDGAAAITTLPVSLAAAATAIGKALDTASLTGDVGVPAMARQSFTPMNQAGSDGDYEFLQMSAGRLWTSGVVTAAATSIGKAEDSASADADVGVPAMAIQQSSPADTAGTNGDYAMLQMSAGRLWASAVVTAAATSIGKAEDSASADADVGVPAMAIQKATPGDTAGADGDYAMLQMSAGRLWTSTEIPVSAASIAKAEDAAHVSGDVGVPALSVRKDTAAATSGTDGDYQPLITDVNGRLHVVASQTRTTNVTLLAHSRIIHPDTVKGTELDVSSGSSLSVFMDQGYVEDVADTNPGRFVISASPKTSGDDTWITIAPFQAKGTNPDKVNLNASLSAGVTALTVDAVTGLAAHDYVYLQDTNGGSPTGSTGALSGAEANSEWAYLRKAASTTATVRDGITNAKDSSDDLYNDASRFEATFDVSSYARVRVDFVHEGATGANCDVRAIGVLLS